MAVGEKKLERLPDWSMMQRPLVSPAFTSLADLHSTQEGFNKLIQRIEALERKVNELIDERNLQIKEDGTLG